ncbi:hypothetical protein J5W02_05610 [Caproiciproducens sp. AGMB10547]|uniref:Uncharacterized protein n=1 Tax=Caproiciproducens faecalis TaxID=2820301 RepID=A0ABS7DMG1_9FIRM|nr:hypothetical protein [Caproiciproducens faecalis]
MPEPQMIQPEPAAEPEAALKPAPEEPEPQNLPEVPTVNESAVSQLEMILPETKPETKAKPSGKTRSGKSASAKSTASKNTVVKEKGTAKRQTGNTRGQKKNNP